MYIESFTLNNFRKFGERDNKVLLAYEKFRDQSKDEEINISTTSTLIIGKNNVGKTSVITALKKLTGLEGFKSTDFNFEYLKEFQRLLRRLFEFQRFLYLFGSGHRSFLNFFFLFQRKKDF